MIDIVEATNETLINELVNRSTFAGIVIHSSKERKLNEEHDNWIINSSLNTVQTQEIISHVSNVFQNEDKDF